MPKVFQIIATDRDHPHFEADTVDGEYHAEISYAGPRTVCGIQLDGDDGIGQGPVSHGRVTCGGCLVIIEEIQKMNAKKPYDSTESKATQGERLQKAQMLCGPTDATITPPLEGQKAMFWDEWNEAWLQGEWQHEGQDEGHFLVIGNKGNWCFYRLDRAKWWQAPFAPPPSSEAQASDSEAEPEAIDGMTH